MIKLSDVRDEHTHAVKSAQDIMTRAEDEGRPLTEKEQAEFDAVQEVVVKREADIRRIEETNKRREILDRDLESLKEGGGRKTEPMPVKATRAVEDSGEDRVYVPEHASPLSSLRAFKGTDARRNAGASGKWLRATFLNDDRARQWCANYGERLGSNFRAQEIGTNTAGGFLVPTPMETAIINLREEYGVFRRECRVIPMARDTLPIPRKSAGLTATFTGESASQTESDLTFDSVSLVAKKLSVITRISTEMAEDAVVDIADMVAEAMSEAFALKEDQCGFLGTGAQTYAGIVGLEAAILQAANAGSKIDATAGIDTMAEVTAAELASFMGNLPLYARRNAKWFCSHVWNDAVFGRLMAAAGGNTIQNMMGGFGPSYMGYPIVMSTLLETLTTTVDGTAYIFFGDLRKAATLGDRRGITVTVADQRYFVEDQIAIKATERFDMNIHDLGTATAAGPVVGYLGNTS